MMGGAYRADQTTCFQVGLTNKLHGGIVGFPRFLRGIFFENIMSLELHHGSGKILGQFVMNLVGYDLPFVVAGLEHFPKRLPLPLQSLLGPFAFRDVLTRTYDSACSSLFVAHNDSIGLHPSVRAIFVMQAVFGCRNAR